MDDDLGHVSGLMTAMSTVNMANRHDVEAEKEDQYDEDGERNNDHDAGSSGDVDNGDSDGDDGGADNYFRMAMVAIVVAKLRTPVILMTTVMTKMMADYQRCMMNG